MNRWLAGVRRPAWAALLLIAVAAPPLSAQATVELQVSTREVYVNEAFAVSIVVSNFQNCDPPEFPPMANCTVNALQSGESSQVSIINGRQSVSRTRTYGFEITAHAPGAFVIPAVTVNVDGQAQKTKPVPLSARPSDADKLFGAEITSERQRVFVGQRVRLTLTVWVKPALMQGRPLSQRDMWSLMRLPNLGPFPREPRASIRQVSGADGTTETQYLYQMVADYVPDRAGQMTFEDIEVAISYPTLISFDIFGQPQISRVRNLRARPQAINLECVAVPTNGRPANFTGAVGTFNIAVAAQPTIVRVGDPIELTIEIRGDGPIETLPAPNLAADPKLSQGFRVPPGELPGEASGSRKRFTQTIRAARADVKEIPALEYPYFDPDREMYAVALSDPIPLTVTPAAQLDTAALVEPGTAAPAPTTAQLRPLDGLRDNDTAETALLRPAPTVSVGSLTLVTVTPAAVFGILWAYAFFVQNRNPEQRRRQGALRAARRRIDQARALSPTESAAEVSAAFSSYLGDRLAEPAARFSGRAAIDFLAERGVTAATVERCAAMLERCAQASFGGMLNGSAADLANEARACLGALERERL